MNYEVMFHEKGSFMELETKGVITVEEAEGSFHSILDHEFWMQGRPLLINHMSATTESLTVNDIMEISKIVTMGNDALGDTKFALAMKSDLDYGQARMWQLYTEDHLNAKIEVFRSREEAVNWLAESV